MLRPYHTHGVEQPDQSFLIGYFDPFPLVEAMILMAGALDAPHINTGLSDAGWKAILDVGAEGQIKKMATLMSTVLADRNRKIENTDIANVTDLITTTNSLWNVLSTIGETVPLRADGPDASRTPAFPMYNEQGGFKFLADANVLTEVRQSDPPPPTFGAIYVPTKTNAWEYELITKDRAGNNVPPVELADRSATMSALARHVARVELAYSLGAGAKLETFWGPQIFGPGDERNKSQQAVQLQRVMNVRMLGLSYSLQPVLFFAHCIREWLFGSAGSGGSYAAELARAYNSADLDFAHAQLNRICELPLSKSYAFALERIGWRVMPTQWGPKPTIDLPSQIQQLVDGGATYDGLLPAQSILGRSSRLGTFIEELFTLITSEYVSAGYKAWAAMVGAVAPKMAQRFLPPPLESALVVTDGTLATEALDAHSLFARPMYRPDLHLGGLTELPLFGLLPAGDEVILSMKAATRTGAGWLHEVGTPLVWRPESEYQGEADAIFVRDLSLATLASTFGITEAALQDSVGRDPRSWKHILTVDAKGAITFKTKAIYRSGRTEDLYPVTFSPKLVGPSTYHRWLEGRPLSMIKGFTSAATTQELRWYATRTSEMPILRSSATGALEDLARRTGVANVARTSVA